MPRSSRRLLVPLLITTLVVGAASVVAAAVYFSIGTPTTPSVAATPTSTPAPSPEGSVPSDAATPTDDPTTTPAPTTRPTRLGDHGQPWGSVDGLTMFRGNPTRSWYGQGLPHAPEVAWQFPPGDGQLCSTSADLQGERKWCGTGWTGQPVVWRRPDGVLEVIVGAYDRQVHFLDGTTGQPTRPPFPTGDLIKGTATLDPDGYPLLYVGSRDDRYRILALDRDRPTELFALEPHPRRLWNNDWDGNGVVVDGVLYLGGEDSWFRAVELNRVYDDQGLVRVDPEVVAEQPGWDDRLLEDIDDTNVSIESSPLVIGDMVYVVNSGGLVSGFDVSRVRDGRMPRVFRYWLGDDADATLVAGPDGTVYAAVEVDRDTARGRQVGQLVALDPTADGDPRLWGVDVRPRRADEDGGLWATPAIHGDHLYVTTHPGDLLVVDRHTGEVVHEERVGYHEWSSPVVVDDTLVLALCEQGRLRAYDLADPSRPEPTWEARVPTGACIESTPAVHDGWIWVGSRDGRIYGFTAP